MSPSGKRVTLMVRREPRPVDPRGLLGAASSLVAILVRVGLAPEVHMPLRSAPLEFARVLLADVRQIIVTRLTQV